MLFDIFAVMVATMIALILAITIHPLALFIMIAAVTYLYVRHGSRRRSVV
jgi:hypothetical protein